jgi:hypothetical protein
MAGGTSTSGMFLDERVQKPATIPMAISRATKQLA